MTRLVYHCEILLYCALAATIMLIACIAAADAETVSKSFYNANGSFAGSSVQRDKSGSYYDGQGRFSGSSVQIGPTTNYYDHQGRFSGSTTTREPRR